MTNARKGLFVRITIFDVTGCVIQRTGAIFGDPLSAAVLTTGSIALERRIFSGSN